MGGFVSTLGLGLTWCACSSVSSICGACCDSTAPGTTGRKRSVLLLALSVALALVFQYALGPALGPKNHAAVANIPYLGGYLIRSWNAGCTEYEGFADDEVLQEKCRGNSGVYRVCATTTLFFLVAAIGTKMKPTFNREVWPAKFSLYFLLVLASVFIPNHPWFDAIYLISARVLAMMFIVMQQIILIDLAYSWNEAWVEKADRADSEEYGSGKKWLRAIVASCVGLFVASLASIGLLFRYFSGCQANEAFVWVTLVLIVVTTAIQLSSEHGSLLTSAVLSLYAVYLAYSAVSKNPDESCNPTLGHHDALGIAAGTILTFLSLAWTGWTYTASSNLLCADRRESVEMNASRSSQDDPEAKDMDSPLLLYDNSPSVTGQVVAAGGDSGTIDDGAGSLLWQLNVVLAFVSCWVAVTLTGWGGVRSIEEEDMANPQTSTMNMWMIIASQWLAISLYTWTLIAPMLFPDRDFS